MGKIKTISTLKTEISRLKKKGKKIVFTNGCFDLLHPGHLKILSDAKKKGDILIVGINSDSSIKKIKPSGRPILDERARAKILEALELVDFVVLFKEKTPYNLIKKIKPDILVKGGDWGKDQIIGSDLVGKVYRIKLYPGYSTTNIINKIKRA
tara:strand:+ start:221 stop:679 length:459 start_codon:yes stop_codon:yes gene_type:complete